MSYIILRGRWIHIIVLNVNSPTEFNVDDMKAESKRNWNVCFICFINRKL
jgi:hypothetical protein